MDLSFLPDLVKEFRLLWIDVSANSKFLSYYIIMMFFAIPVYFIYTFGKVTKREKRLDKRISRRYKRSKSKNNKSRKNEEVK